MPASMSPPIDLPNLFQRLHDNTHLRRELWHAKGRQGLGGGARGADPFACCRGVQSCAEMRLEPLKEDFEDGVCQPDRRVRRRGCRDGGGLGEEAGDGGAEVLLRGGRHVVRGVQDAEGFLGGGVVGLGA